MPLIHCRVTLAKITIPYLFSKSRFLIDNTDIRNVVSQGQATAMKSLLTWGNNFVKGEGLNVCWQMGNTTTADATKIGFDTKADIHRQARPLGAFSFTETPVRLL